MRKFNAIDQLEIFTGAGVPDEQAKVQVKALQLVKEDIESNLATKRDVKELDIKIETVRANLEEKIAKSELQLKHDLTLRMVYVALGSVSVLGALMAYLKFFVPVVIK